MNNPILFPHIKIEKIKNKKVVFWGIGSGMKTIKRLIDVPYHMIGYCDNNSNLWGKYIENTIVMSPLQLKEKIERNQDIVIIIASEYYNEIQQQLKELEINTEIYVSFTMYADGYYRLKRRLLDKGWNDQDINKYIYFYNTNLARYHDEILNSKRTISILSPEKTGNLTIRNSTKKNKDIIWLYHSVDRMFPIYKEKMSVINRIKKIIIGVRTPIEQNLAILFQHIFFLCIDNGEDGYNVQKMFNKYIIDSICNEDKKRRVKDYGFEYCCGVPSLIQSWFDDILKKEIGIDIYTRSFDKVKGYSCYKISGYSIFIYRLDKLNQLENELGTFLEIDNFKLKNTNIAKDKWYSETYNQFKKEVILSKQYIDLTYSGKFMKHFYTEDEMVESKKKWIKHVKL